MKTLRIAPAVVALCLFASANDTQAQEAGVKKIVFVAGKPSHGPGEHEHRAGCLLLADHLNRSGLPVNAVVTHGGWPEDESIFEGAAAVVMYADGGGGHPAMAHLASLREFASRGVGLGAIHYAVEVPKGEPGDLFLDLIGGYFETDWSVNPHWDAVFKIPEHPVTRGVRDFELRDEWYYHMRFRENLENVVPILSAVPPADSLSRPDGPHSGNPHVREAVARKEPQHVLWLFERPDTLGGGRAFGFTGGHFHRNWQQDDYRRVVLNSIAWIAGVEIPDDGVLTKTPTDEEMAANLDEKS